MKNPIIELRGLTKRYGSVKAVDNLNLNISRGEVFGLLGPNGAGKTTTILMMLGLTEPTEGTAHVCGYNATTSPISVKRKVGYMPDSLGFYDSMTGIENLMYIGELNGIPQTEIKQRAINVMKLVGLENDIDKKTAAYSRGMKQRLGLADVLIKEPDVVILDEPTLGIDPSGVKEFLALIRRLSREQRLTVMLSSHHLHQVQQVCDRVGIFVKGKLVVEGTMDTLYANLFEGKSFDVLVSLRNSVTLPREHESELLQVKGVTQVAVNQDEITATCSHDVTPEIVRYFVQKGYDVTGVHRKEFGLDDIYQKYFEVNLN